MISLETAKKLKSAGLEWEPQAGDMYYWESWTDGWEIRAVQKCEIVNALYEIMELIKEGEWIFAPRLNQLLAEIEKRGYAYRVTGKWGTEPYKITVIKEKPLLDFNSWGYSPEEATAQVLLWILEQEVTP